jgi:predicted Zn-dependent peptidase
LYRKTVLSNGLRILTEPMAHTRSVTICLFVGVGSRYEPNTRAGISHFVEHLIFRGTARRPVSGDISGAIEGLGGVLNGGTDRESTVYWCKVPCQHFGVALDVLSDVLLNSRFDADDIEKERQVIFEEINMGFDNPPSRVEQLIDSVLWPGHPLGRDIAGSRRSVSAIKKQDMLNHIIRHYRPAATVVSIAGNIKHSQAARAVEELLGGWPAGAGNPRFRPYREKVADRLVVETRDIEQSHVCLALPGLSRSHPDRFKLDLMNIVLGEGMSCRLFTEVRDKLGLAYAVSSYTEHLADSGALTVYAGVEPKRLEEAIRAVQKELRRMTRELIPEEELGKAREMAKGRMLLHMEDSRYVAGWMGGQEVLTGGVLTVDQVSAILDAVSPAEIKKLAEELITTDDMRLAVVGPTRRTASLEALLQ